LSGKSEGSVSLICRSGDLDTEKSGVREIAVNGLNSVNVVILLGEVSESSGRVLAMASEESGSNFKSEEISTGPVN